MTPDLPVINGALLTLVHRRPSNPCSLHFLETERTRPTPGSNHGGPTGTSQPHFSVEPTHVPVWKYEGVYHGDEELRV